MMSDLISRQAAIDALGERPTVWTSCDEYALGGRNQYDCDRLAIETAPPAVVRCEDCRYGYQFYDVQNGVKDSWIECRNPDGLNRDVPEDGYCYCGERKDDAEQV